MIPDTANVRDFKSFPSWAENFLSAARHITGIKRPSRVSQTHQRNI